MKKGALGVIAIAALIGTPALAAKKPLKAPPPPPPACAWCGWYVGVNAGGAWDASTVSSFSGNPATAAYFAYNEFPTSLSPDPKGVIGGGQIGYNWQASPNFILGWEADIQGSGYKGTATAAPTPTAGTHFTTSIEQHSDWIGTVRARAGFAANPTLLIYGTGGLA